jgi:2-haloacid dehalogenase
MSMTRRDFVRLAAAGTFAGLVTETANAAPIPRPIKAIAFDAFAIFDPRPVAALAQQLFPEHGSDLISEWRTRQFEYTWLRVAERQYADFWHVTGDALAYAANRVNIQLSSRQHEQLMHAYLELKS